MSLTIRTDVTAVKFFKNLIFAGIGSYVNVYDRQTNKLLDRIHSLNAQKVHGFVLSNCRKKVLVFGGKQFTVLAIEGSEDVTISRCSPPVLCDDWMLAALWAEDDLVTLLSAHNAIQNWKLSDQTLVSQHCGEDVSILYSGLLLPVENRVIVLAGTVYSEVIIHECSGERKQVLHRLQGHRGVIFSICCDPVKAMIVTTSDDRSVRIWTMKNPDNLPHETFSFWEHTQIECSHEVYGHAARVMRSFITRDYVVSCGEDAAICYWTLDGSFVRKVVSHQTATVWAVDCDDNYLVTGGGDAGIVLHPLTVASDYYKKEIIDIEGNVKKIQFTARNNIVAVNDDDKLIYYDVKCKLQTSFKLFHRSTYCMLSVSPCKQLVCVGDMFGNVNVYAENCKDACLQPLVDFKIDVDFKYRLMTTHWAGNRHLVLCTDEGVITVLESNGISVDKYAKFRLPLCKERYITAAAINLKKNMIIVGDRCGNVLCFKKGQEAPVKICKRVQGSYGPTSMIYRNNEIVTTGRVGKIAYHTLERNKQNIWEFKVRAEKTLEFQWVEKFLDKNENLVCGFHDKNFVVVNLKTNTKIFEVFCGGGHRPWDAIRYFEKIDNKHEESIKLTFVKNTNVYLVTTQLCKITSKPIVTGSHSKVINSLKTYKTDLDDSMTYYISGGEDTTLRVSSMNSDLEFQDEFVFKHLSNIRSVKIFPFTDKVLVMSAGGRAQLCINLFKFEMQDGKIKVTHEELANAVMKDEVEEKKRLRNWRNHEFDYNPETRLMDVDAIKFDEHKYLIFLGCSDTVLRVCALDQNSEKQMQFKHMQDINYDNCILKTVCIPYQGLNIVATATTRGQISFLNVISNENQSYILQPFKNSCDLKNAGINSFDYKVFESSILIAVGGDDGLITILLLSIEMDSLKGHLSINIIDKKTIEGLYGSQVSGLILLDDTMISASIDQRVTVNQWKVLDNKIHCDFLRQVYTDVADVAGLNLVELNRDSATVCVFGKGLEVLKLDLTPLK
ncbi:hypothetical protein O0L34_g5219 [Tuta absoluta]|nr:hypothetical protein O0L34_g5219 [Tuta absoluta]